MTWKKLDEMRILGKSYTRIDGPEKVTGRAKYTYDIQIPGMLYGRILRSPHPHARIISIDASAVKALPGVKAVLTDIKKEVMFVGDEVAAVAAVNEDIANDALALFKVEYEILPFTVVEDEALKSDSPQVFANRENNLGRKNNWGEGDVDQGFRDAEIVLERTYRMQVQVHTPLETHGCVAKWDGDELYMWDSSQGVHSCRAAMAKSLEMPENKVYIITHHMGGGFGSKLGPKGYNIIAAKLARQAGEAVKVMLDREEDVLATGNRPSSVQKIKIGAKRDGTLTAFELESHGTGGIGGGAGVPQPYVYAVPNFKVSHTDVYINAGPGAPMRAPGNPQANFAMESIMDELAEALQMDPLELRLKNDPNQTRQQEFKIGADKIGWSRRPKTGTTTGVLRRGIGVGAGSWNVPGAPDTKALVSIFADGSVDVQIGTQDIGVGTRTIVAGVAAEELGLEVKDIVPLIGESRYPWATASGGSMTVPSVAPAIKRAAEKARLKLVERVAANLKVPATDIEQKNKEFSSKTSPDKKMTWKEACALIRGGPITELEGWAEGLSDRGVAGCQFAEVEVDSETGQVKVLKMVAVQDCGLVLNALTAKNQVNGAIIGEIGYVLLENRILDAATGVMVNPELENYKIPGAVEMPEFDVTMFDESHRGVIGLGEPPAIPGVGAIANAVANAIGVRIRELPITPDKVLMALARGKEDKE